MTWWPFGQQSFLDSDDEEWQIETWRWFLGQFGGLRDLKHSPLVLPTREFFPPTQKTNHERAEHIFECVKRLARMPDWPCRLIAQLRRPELRVGEYVALKPITHSPAGTFGFDGDEVVISYEASAVDEPGMLIATLAHELAHYLLLKWRKEIPGGEELHEFTTDLLTVYMGFGVFGVSTAFHFEADVGGWRWSRHGYLSQRAWIFACAIFLELRNEPCEVLKPFLKQHLFSDLGKAALYIHNHDVTARITAPSA